MVDSWWQTADGAPRDCKRECARILRALADGALIGEGLIDTSPFRGEAIDALVVSGTLTDLGLDRAAFQHDVFREWAIASLLTADLSLLDDLSLNRPATAAMARGTELAARLALERDTKGDQLASIAAAFKRRSCARFVASERVSGRRLERRMHPTCFREFQRNLLRTERSFCPS